MLSLNFRVKDLLEKIKENRELHIKIVQESQVGYRRELEKELKAKLMRLEEGYPVEPRIELKVPTNHVDDYDRAIEMLSLCTDTEIELSEDMFQCYVRDKWRWQKDFLWSNSRYSETAHMTYSQVK